MSRTYLNPAQLEHRRTAINPKRKARSAQRKAERRAKAEARNARWAALSDAEKAAELRKRPGECKRQWDRLNRA